MISSISNTNFDDSPPVASKDYERSHSISSSYVNVIQRPANAINNNENKMRKRPHRQLVITAAVNNLAMDTNFLVEPLSPTLHSPEGFLELPPSYEEIIVVTPKSTDNNSPFHYHFRTSFV